MRCPDCNKFVSYEEEEPEINSLDISDDGTVTAEVRIVNVCADCGNELKEATFEFDASHDVDDHMGEGHDLEIEEESSERTCRSGYFKKGEFITNYGRYAKTFYGAEVGYHITCSCGGLDISDSFSDDVQASGMDELV